MPKAIQMYQYGEPSVLVYQEIDLPALSATEVRIKTIASAVNRADINIRSGKWKILHPSPFPYTPGMEVVGEVIEKGDQVFDLQIGDYVITMMQQLGGVHGIRAGGYQEYVTVESQTVVQVEKSVEDIYSVAAMGLAGVTALNGIKRLKLKSGEKIVIQGATGGIGSFAIAIAKSLNTYVIATTSSNDKDDDLYERGVDQIVHLHKNSQREAIGVGKVDAVLELLGSSTFYDSVSILKKGGRLCLLGTLTGAELHCSAWDLLHEIEITGYSAENLTCEDLGEDMNTLQTWLQYQTIQVPNYHQFALQDASIAHEQISNRQLTGRVLLVP